jgi:NADH-quinone oxidoreductase subunit M
MPVYTALAMGLFFAGLGLPGLCGFIGEVLVVLSVWNYSKILAIISAAVVILTAAYILWCVQRVYLGAEYQGPHEEALTPSTLRERLIGGVLLGCAILFGVLPHHTVLKYMDPTIDRQVEELTNWTKQVKDPLGNSATKPEADEQAQTMGPVGNEPQTVSVANRKPVQTTTSRAAGGFAKLAPPPPPLTTAP